MNRYLHPETGIPIDGMRLAPGVQLRESDQYASSDGTWRVAPSHASGLILQERCETLWVRPRAELSPEGNALLKYLVSYHFCLTRCRGPWLAILSARWKNDERAHWEVQHRERVQELIDYGFVAPSAEDEEVYELSALGKAEGEKLLN